MRALLRAGNILRLDLDAGDTGVLCENSLSTTLCLCSIFLCACYSSRKCTEESKGGMKGG